MSAEKKVITIKGEELPISQCRKFKGIWYKIGNINIVNSGDCYLINERYFREETGNIVYNYSLNKYVIYDGFLTNGVVDIVNNELIIGYFNTDVKYSKITDKNGKFYWLLKADIFKESKEYREELSTGNFYHISRLPAYKFNKIVRPRQEYKCSLPYDSKGIINSNLIKYSENYNPEISKNIKNYSKLLDGLSFGLEFETTAGFIPNRILDKYGLIPLRDGSITGIEYVTVPMSGEKGLQCVYDVVNTLKERTIYNDGTCSLHLHLGNIPRTKEFILAFFKLGIKIQDEMFQMFPLYKKYNYHIKNKNYSSPLPAYEILSQLDSLINSENINRNFGVLYKYLSMGQSFADIDNNIDNIVSHPQDPKGEHKWNVHTRYLIYNLIPLLFGNKQTIEFRIHTPTYEINKIIPFILMNSLLVNFVIKYQKHILENKSFLVNYDLRSILNVQIDNYKIGNPSLFKDLIYEYITKRKNVCENQTMSGNILGTESEIPAPKTIDWSSNVENDLSTIKSKISYLAFNESDIKSAISSIISSPRAKHTITDYWGNDVLPDIQSSFTKAAIDNINIKDLTQMTIKKESDEQLF